jgi:hypothetical protein
MDDDREKRTYYVPAEDRVLVAPRLPAPPAEQQQGGS